MLKTFVKINHVSNLSVARYCAGMFVDVVGFCVDQEDENYVPFEKYKEMVGWLSGVKICIETNSDDYVFIKTMTELYSPDMIEVTHESLLSHRFETEVIFKGKTRLTEISHHNQSDLLGQNDIFEVNGLTFNELELDSLPKISLNAPKEERPGFQDFGDLMDILEKLDVD